jgi:hypothetical protein
MHYDRGQSLMQQVGGKVIGLVGMVLVAIADAVSRD